MFYEYAMLDKCNRTALNGKSKIILRPKSKTQLVLGTNSSGKSSLLELAFSPLPPEPHNFEHGGSWEVRFNHKGKNYVCTAEYGEKNHYTFCIDGGENLNRGRTITAQLDLVKQHLGYTRDLHSILVGRLRFTQMTTKQRQDWISALSANDFTYAYTKYAEWKKQHNKSKTITGHLKEQIVDAKARMIDPDDAAEMRKKADELHQQLDELMRVPRTGVDPVDEDMIHELIRVHNERIDKWLYREFPDVGKAKRFEELTEEHRELQVEEHQLSGQLKALGEHLAECENRKARVQSLIDMEPEDLKRSIEEIEQQLLLLQPTIIDLPSEMLIPAGPAIMDLRVVLASLPHERKTADDINQLSEGVFQKQLRVSKIGAQVADISGQIFHIQQCAEVECPSCRTSFKPGIEAGKLEELQARLARGEELSGQESHQLFEMQEILSDARAVADAYRELDIARDQHQFRYPGLFAYLDQCGWTKLGRQMGEKLAIYDRDQRIVEDRTRLTKRLQDAKAALAEYQKESANVSVVMDDYEKAFKAYNELFRKLSNVRIDVYGLAQRNQTAARWEAEYDQAESGVVRLKEVLVQYSNYLADTMITEAIQKTKVSIGVHEAALHENETFELLVKDLEIQLERSKVEEEAYKRLTDAMCPKTGLIAEQISQQLTGILGAVNDIISRVWEYPLYISPGEVGETDVDYKFPMTVGDVPRPDISAGSSSVRDIIDQAFRWTVYYCMDLTDYPLYLDELGATFDPMHQHKLIPFIKDLIDDPRFSQVLIISHALDGQTAYPSAEVVILDDRNIKFPHAYNQHVEFY